MKTLNQTIVFPPAVRGTTDAFATATSSSGWMPATKKKKKEKKKKKKRKKTHTHRRTSCDRKKQCTKSIHHLRGSERWEGPPFDGKIVWRSCCNNDLKTLPFSSSTSYVDSACCCGGIGISGKDFSNRRCCPKNKTSDALRECVSEERRGQGARHNKQGKESKQPHLPKKKLEFTKVSNDSRC
jgi:hypothetical protein